MVWQRFRGALVAAGVPGGIFAWLFVAILGSALSVVRHADQLAVRLGEPYGTLILTLSVVVIEVASITAIMLHGENNPTLTRDTLFAVVMIILNGMVGLALLVGGLRHREQHYNLQGANAYLGVILPLIAFSLLLPDFTQTTPGPTLSIGQSTFIAIVAVGLYLPSSRCRPGGTETTSRLKMATCWRSRRKARPRASCRMSCCWSPT